MSHMSREWRVPCPVELVWQVATDLEHTAWRTDLREIKVLDEEHYLEIGSDGVTSSITVTAKEPYSRYALQVEGRAAFGSRELRLREESGQTVMTLSGEVMGRSALINLMERLYLKKFTREYLRDLNNELHRIVHEEA